MRLNNALADKPPVAPFVGQTQQLCVVRQPMASPAPDH